MRLVVSLDSLEGLYIIDSFFFSYLAVLFVYKCDPSASYVIDDEFLLSWVSLKTGRRFFYIHFVGRHLKTAQFILHWKTSDGLCILYC